MVVGGGRWWEGGGRWWLEGCVGARVGRRVWGPAANGGDENGVPNPSLYLLREGEGAGGVGRLYVSHVGGQT